MAKGTGGGNTKTSFGKRKKGKAQKSRNKHDRKAMTYRGQGR
jgi:hypothetical protein